MNIYMNISPDTQKRFFNSASVYEAGLWKWSRFLSLFKRLLSQIPVNNGRWADESSQRHSNTACAPQKPDGTELENKEGITYTEQCWFHTHR